MPTLKAKIKVLPSRTGVYLFKDKRGKVIYVGKAKNLRSRVGQYFGAHDNRPQIPYLMQDTADFDFTVVSSELESLFLENTLIKQYMPQYNIMLRDDKNYAFIKIDYSTQIPQIGYARKVEHDGSSKSNRRSSKGKQGKINGNGRNNNRAVNGKRAKYFGPYSSARKIKQTLDFSRKIFPYCANSQIGQRPCFYYYLHRCPGVCIGQISLEEYGKQVERIVLFLSGKTREIKRELKSSMTEASHRRQFEQAARLRDQLRAIEVLDERQVAMFPKRIDWDFISLVESGTMTCINLFKVREGRLIDKENFIYDSRRTDGEYSANSGRSEHNNADRVADSVGGHVSATLQAFLEQYYADASDLPREVYVETRLDNPQLIEQLIKRRAGYKITVSVPTRGKKLQLINLGKTNAKEYLYKWQASQAVNLDAIKKTLEVLKNILSLPTIPRRIEGYDISNIQGTNPVGCMVVFKDGLPTKSEYRKFKISVKQTPDDFAMIKEMLTRRLSRLPKQPAGEKPKAGIMVSNETSAGGSIASKDTWPRPDLLVIDGGKGQLGVAIAVLKQKNLDIPAIGLAKRIEEIFLPGQSEPIILGHDHPALQLLQRLRDEAHRFAITFHRSLRGKQAIKSALDTIPGIGPKTKKLLKQKFGAIAKIRQASREELAELLGQSKARQIKKYL